MRTRDAEQKIREAVPALNSELMSAKLKEYGRFGLPGASMSDGRGGSPPLPMLGNMDRSILLARRQYEQDLMHAALALDSALRLQNAWCIPRTDDTEKAEKLAEPVGVPCGNVYCHDAETGTQRRITGLQNNRGRKVDGVGPVLCERCYRFELRTQRRWTPALEALEAS